MGMDGMVGRLFFFCTYLENYYIFFLNCFSSLKYMFLHIFWNIRRKKSEYSFFQNILPKSSTTFFRKFFQGFLNFSKTTRYIFLIVFGPLRRMIKTSYEKKIKKKNRILFLSKNFASFFFDEIWKMFKGISLIKTKVHFSRYRVRTPVRALSSDYIKGNLSNIVKRRKSADRGVRTRHLYLLIEVRYHCAIPM